MQFFLSRFFTFSLSLICYHYLYEEYRFLYFRLRDLHVQLYIRAILRVYMCRIWALNSVYLVLFILFYLLYDFFPFFFFLQISSSSSEALARLVRKVWNN